MRHVLHAQLLTLIAFIDRYPRLTFRGHFALIPSLQKHKIAKKLQSGKRTKKSLRKEAHKERVADKVELTHGDADEQMADVSKSSLKRKNPKQKKKLKLAPRSAAAAAAADAQQMED